MLIFRKEIVGLCKLFKKLVATYGAESTSSVAAMSSAALITIPTQVLKIFKTNKIVYGVFNELYELCF
jgi:hypothetical protein